MVIGKIHLDALPLILTGLITQVGDLRAENGHDYILLTWNPPFSLDVTGVDPDIWYTVLISNVTDEHNSTAIPCTDCHNLVQPNYTFTTAKPSPCHKYRFIIIPQNGVGVGSRSEPVIGYFATGILKGNLSHSISRINFIHCKSCFVLLEQSFKVLC